MINSEKVEFNQVRGHSKGQSDHKIVHDTPPSQDASTHQIRDSYLNINRRYALDMIILEMRPGQGHSDLNMVLNTPSSQDASTHQIWDSYLK